MDVERIAIQDFLALTCLLGPSEGHIKSLQLLDTGKVVNLHKFKMTRPNLKTDHFYPKKCPKVLYVHQRDIISK